MATNTQRQEYILDTSKTEANLKKLGQSIAKASKGLLALNKAVKEGVSSNKAFLASQQEAVVAMQKAVQVLTALAVGQKQGATSNRQLISAVQKSTVIYDANGRVIRIVTAETKAEDVARRKATATAERQAKVIAQKNIQAQQELKLLRQRNLAANIGQAAFLGTTGLPSPTQVLSPQLSVQLQQLLANLREVFRQSGLTQAKLKNLITGTLTGKVQKYSAAQLKVAQAVLRTRTEYAKLIKEQNKVFKTAHSGVQKMVLGWSNFARFFVTHIIYRLFYATVTAIRAGITAAAELQVRLSEIRTISQQNQQTVGAWATQVRDLSDAYGKSLSDVAEGVYQTLSNQIAHGAEATIFLKEALKLATVGVSSTADAVNALSSVINSYGLEAEDAEIISARLFKTVELGRLRISDMANNIGQLTILTSQLGIRQEALYGAIATTTKKGVQYHTASTLIRNVLLKLIKPTEEMAAFFDKIGVASGEAAIAAYGLPGVLSLIEEHTRGSSSALGELFSRVRAITGAAVFAGKGLQDLKDNIDAITYDAFPSYEKALKIAFETPGKRLQLELNKLKNYFVKDIGFNSLVIIDKITRSWGGLVNIVKKVGIAVQVLVAYLISFKVIIPLIKIMVLDFKSLKLALLSVKGAAISTSAALSAIGGVILLITTLLVGFGLQHFAAKAAAAEYARDATLAYESVGQAAKSATQNQVNELIKLQEALTETKRKFLQEIADITKNTNVYIEQTKKAGETILEGLEVSVKGVTKAVQESISDLKTAIKDSQSLIEESQEYVDDLIYSLSLDAFTLAIENAKPEDAIKALLDEAREFERIAKEWYGVENYTEARKYFEQSRKYLEDAKKRIADFGGDDPTRKILESINILHGAILDSVLAQLKVEQELQQIEQDRVIALEKQRKIQEKQFATLKPLLSDLVKFEPDYTGLKNLDLKNIPDVPTILAEYDILRDKILANTELAGAEGLALITHIEQRRLNLVTQTEQEITKAIGREKASQIAKATDAAEELVTNEANTVKRLEAENKKLVTTLETDIKNFADKSGVKIGTFYKAWREAGYSTGEEFDQLLAKLAEAQSKIDKILASRQDLYGLGPGGKISEVFGPEHAEKTLQKYNLDTQVQQANDLAHGIGIISQNTIHLAQNSIAFERSQERTVTNTANLDKVTKNLGTTLDGIIEGFRNLATTAGTAEETVDELAQKANESWNSVTSIYSTLKGATRELEKQISQEQVDFIQTKLKEADEHLVKVHENIAALAEGNEDQKREAEALRLKLIEQQTEYNAIVLGVRAITEAHGLSTEATDDATTSTENLKKEMEGTQEAAEPLAKDLDSAAESTETIAEEAEAIEENFEGTAKASKETAATTKLVQEFVTKVRQELDIAVVASRTMQGYAFDTVNPYREIEGLTTNIYEDLRNSNKALEEMLANIGSFIDNTNTAIDVINEWEPPQLPPDNSYIGQYWDSIGRQKGGIVPYLGGLRNRFKDSILAALTPGEFVVNSTAATRFRPQLEAINSGRAPSSVTSNSTTIGDINITVTGRETGVDIEELGSELQRAVRQGRIVLN